jgi:hypothetical protein
MSVSFYSYSKDEHGPTEWVDGPNFSNHNAAMIARSLGLEDYEYGGVWPLDEFEGRVLLAMAVPPVEDDGQPDVVNGNHVHCGVRPGYFADAYGALADLCRELRDKGIDRVIAA